MRKILVIGEHSYIGTSFRDYMAECEPETCVTLAGARDDEWKRMDFQGYDVVLHAAAVVHRKEEPGMRRLYLEVNAKLPYEVAKKAKKSGVRQFLFLSTMAVYGKEAEIIKKTTKVCPTTLYAKSKRKAERVLKRLADESFQVIVFRPPMVYGAGCPGNYQRLAKLALHTPVFPKTDNKRSMIYIENLCECFRQAILSSEKTGNKDQTGWDVAKETYRICCPQNAEYVNTSKLVREIRAAHRKRTWLVPFPRRPVRICAAKIGMIKKVFGNCYYEKDEVSGEYQKTDFRESVRRTEGIQ